MIGIVDYGAGNLRSVYKGFEAVGRTCRVTSDPTQIESLSGLVLPGVGAFAQTMDRLRTLSLVDPIVRFIESGRPFLGICLGLQVLMDESDETFRDGERSTVRGLGVVRGRVRRLPRKLKVPQIGWNSVEFTRTDIPLFRGLKSGAFFYFVHSYYVEPDDRSVVACRCDYGVDFAASIHFDNVYAVQFHPEKSGRNGLSVLDNFAGLVER